MTDVRNILYKCFPGNVGTCFLCEKHCELLRDKIILSVNVRKKCFVICCPRKLSKYFLCEKDFENLRANIILSRKLRTVYIV